MEFKHQGLGGEIEKSSPDSLENPPIEAEQDPVGFANRIANALINIRPGISLEEAVSGSRRYGLNDTQVEVVRALISDMQGGVVDAPIREELARATYDLGNEINLVGATARGIVGAIYEKFDSNVAGGQ